MIPPDLGPQSLRSSSSLSHHSFALPCLRKSKRQFITLLYYLPINSGEDPKNLHAVVFDIITAESALIGVADQLLSNMIPPPDQLMVLDKRLMKDNVWLLFDGGICDLTDDALLLTHAQLLVRLQGECRVILDSRRGKAR